VPSRCTVGATLAYRSPAFYTYGRLVGEDHVHLACRPHWVFAFIAASVVGCGSATAPTVEDVLTERALWSAQGLTAYSFDYEEAGFFICCTEGQVLRLDVRNDTVVSAVFAATGQPVSGCPPSCPGATIDRLFALALQALHDQRLSRIAFDPLLHYPTRMDLAGPPDASGSENATDLQPLR
jgi:hypothetical protein